MRILIVGDLSSIWLDKLLSRLIPLTNHSFFILDIFRAQYLPATRLKETRLIKLPEKGLRKNIFHFISSLKSILILLFSTRFDIIHIHFANPLLYFFLPLLKLKSRKILVSLYGSDFYKLSPKQYRRQEVIYNASTKITVTNHRISEDFLKCFPLLRPKIVICRFGLSILHEIDQVEGDSVKAKSILKFPHDKIILCIGHSANVREQHPEIIAQLRRLPDSLKKRLLAVLPFTYNSFAVLYNKVDHDMKASGINYVILTKHLSDRDVAALRLSSDIMLNLPISDQMTAAMLETLYAGGVVITGSWLPYDKLDAEKISYIKIDRMDELPQKLEDVFERHSMAKPVVDAAHNKTVIGKLFNWNECIEDWRELYSEKN